ncbi:GNAT family N-acetyltransferase [Lysobacter sp. TY2-98]|uniref:GNAT family N-acetyltransferase n=1 Tax=Lysobacter sp. TY2-98 TaxID=2290922 RepID=UPI0013B37BC9|nr:GNAT family N-acetyltransferase [Lysobacter sp. TY2-98]
MRRLRPIDADLFRRLYTCPQVMESVGPPLTVEEANDAFVRACTHNAGDSPGHRFWTVERAGEKVGIVALVRSEASGEIGLLLTPEAWTGNYSRPVLRRVINHCFRAMSLDEVVAESKDGIRERVSRRLLSDFPFERIAAATGRARWRLTREAWARARRKTAPNDA